MGRSLPSITPIERIAVKSIEEDESLFGQMNSIMNGKKKKYSSVQEAVDEMRERSGVVSHRKKESEMASRDVVKNASKKPDYTPQLLKKFPEIKNTFENYIQQTKGNISIPGIIEHVHSLHKNDVNDESLWNDQKLLVYVSQLNLGAKQNNPAVYHQYHNLGKLDHSETDIDPENTDAFSSLMPNTALK